LQGHVFIAWRLVVERIAAPKPRARLIGPLISQTDAVLVIRQLTRLKQKPKTI
jgi:hypothetical protein